MSQNLVNFVVVSSLGAKAEHEDKKRVIKLCFRQLDEFGVGMST